MRIEDIKTEQGNQVLFTLLDEGWVKEVEYGPLMFDKAIDYDFYALRRGEHTLHFEWDNWFEWSIDGPDDVVRELAERFGLGASGGGKGASGRTE